MRMLLCRLAVFCREIRERGYMETVFQKEGLKEIFDQVIRKMTEQVAGISLCRGNLLPAGELYTVYIAFEEGFCNSISLCAEKSLFARLTQYMMQEEQISAQDMEDFTKEYFNMLCGQISYRMFQATNIASRFGIPAFHCGHYIPEGHREYFGLSYTSDENENARLTIMCREAAE